jgi:hypothetical protein
VYHTPPSTAGATSCGCDPAGTGKVSTLKLGASASALAVARDVPGTDVAAGAAVTDATVDALARGSDSALQLAPARQTRTAVMTARRGRESEGVITQ